MGTDSTHYVYGWYTLDGVCFYVGKGKGWRYKSTRYRNKRFLEFISKNEYEIRFFKKCLEEQEALILEIELINELKPSCNMMKGGQRGAIGLVHSEETREKIRETLSDPEIRERISLSKLGIPRAPEVIEKMRQTRITNGSYSGLNRREYLDRYNLKRKQERISKNIRKLALQSCL